VSAGAREHLDRLTLQKRLLLCLYALGTNTGLKRMSGGEHSQRYKDLLYVHRRFLHRDALRNAIAQVANAIFQARLTHIWGEATTACASDSKKFGAWDQNLLTEWHARYRGPGIMIYWHLHKKGVLYLLPAQELLLLGGGGHDRGRPAPLHGDERRSELRRFPWSKRRRFRVYQTAWL
jgi:hypothetical protein